MSASGKSLLGLWLYRSGESNEWAVKEGSPIHKPKDLIASVIKLKNFNGIF
jgi:hypothetical protein